MNVQMREQLQEDIITLLSSTEYECLSQPENGKNLDRPTVKDRLTDRLCEAVCQIFFERYGV